jgi:hypothetical protein
MLAKSADRTVCFRLIYYKAQLCGRIPRESLNHIHLVVVCDLCCVLFLYDILSLH